ncbi:MAG: hypothetical protein AABX96_03245 [Nanoarchaeota archaeon]
MKNKKSFFDLAPKDIQNHAKWQYNTFFLDTIIPSLEFMINEGRSYLNGMTFKEWKNILKEMKEGFELLNKVMLKDGGWSFIRKLNKKDKIKIDKSFHLFRKHFFDLWD